MIKISYLIDVLNQDIDDDTMNDVVDDSRSFLNDSLKELKNIESDINDNMSIDSENANLCYIIINFLFKYMKKKINEQLKNKSKLSFYPYLDDIAAFHMIIDHEDSKVSVFNYNNLSEYQLSNFRQIGQKFGREFAKTDYKGSFVLFVPIIDIILKDIPLFTTTLKKE